MAWSRYPPSRTCLHFICENGYEHHVAVNPTRVASAICTRLSTKYLGWDVYYHKG